MRCANSFPKALPNIARTPWKTPKNRGMNHFWEGLSSALSNPRECVPAGTARQRIKRMFNMMAVVVII